MTHNYLAELTISNDFYRREVERFVGASLKSDLQRGDVTSELIIASDTQVKAVVRAKETLLLAGIEEVKTIFELNFNGVEQMKVRFQKEDGAWVEKGETMIEIEGLALPILKLERTLLNTLQRMSGIASETQELVEITKGHSLICGTRKTLWGLLDKKAVAVGGGGTHRLNLGDAVLLKDTHLKIAGDFLVSAVKKLFEAQKKIRFVEIEVESKAEAEQVLNIYADLSSNKLLVLMLDNFKAKEIMDTLKFYRNKYPELAKSQLVKFEASGGITRNNIQEYAATGVDIISMGALTMSAKAKDIHLKIVDAF